MSRRPARSAIQFSLFPFLAVLLCTMGSLIVLLLVLVQQARVEAEEQTDPVQPIADAQPAIDPEEAAKQRQQAEQQREQLQTVATQLEEMRTELQERLQTTQLELSHLDDHIRRLRDKLAQMEADYQVLKQQHNEDDRSRLQKRADLMQLKQQIEIARAELDEAKQQAATKPRSYSIVPYDGPRGTRRRPIYLECRADRLIIHPEGNLILPVDLELDHAGNPLAAALRATREYLLESGSLQGGEPYPLLLVRPDGAETYSAARAAMQSWSSEYGYELIDADMSLEFPPADEALGDVVRRAIKLARERQLAMLQAQARSWARHGALGGVGGPRSRGSRGAYLSASRNGGFELSGGSDSGDDWLDEHVYRPEANAGAQQRDPAHGGFYPAEQRDAGTPAGTGRQHGGAQSNAADATSDTRDPLQTSASPHSEQQRQTPQRGTPSGSTPPDSQQPGIAGGYATQPSEGDQIAPLLGQGDSQASADGEPANDHAAPVAAKRGKNWALPSSARNATAFNRPIRVQVQANRLIVLPDRGDAGPTRMTQLDGPMQNSIDHFVSQIWEHMNAWGIAGPQAYWKPILSVDVASGGEARYAELAALMQHSGVEVQRKK